MKKTIKGWAAINGVTDYLLPELNDPQNVSFFKTKREAQKVFRKSQQYIPCTITYQLPPKKRSRKH